MIDHVDFEVSEEKVRDCVAFYEALGFYEAEPPAALAHVPGVILVHGCGPWLALLVRDEPVVMPHGHIAVVVPDLSAAVDRIRGLGASFDERASIWGAARGFTNDPQGNRVELLEHGPTFTARPDAGRQAQMLIPGQE